MTLETTSPPTVVIEPTRGWASLQLRAVWTYLTSMLSPATFRSALEIGLESLGWVRSG